MILRCSPVRLPSELNAERLVEHLLRSGFVLIRRPPVSAPA